MTTLVLLAVALADPISTADLRDALKTPPSAEAAASLAARVRETEWARGDLKRGVHHVENDLVAFVIDAPGAKTARVGGDFVMINRGRGRDMVPLGDSGLFALVETVPQEAKFAFRFEVDGKKLGGAAVEMPKWAYPPESKEVPGRKYGEYRPLKFRSEVFGNNRTGWVYVPAAYDGKTPAAVMFFQDGDAYKGEHVGTVVENLIAEGAMPITIVVGLNPGVNDDGRSNRSVEYDTLSDKYVTFLDREVFPKLKADFKIRDDAAGHAIGGASSGGICAFTAAWERPDLFGRVLSQIGSFTNIRGGNVYPDLVRKAEKKPIRVVLQDGSNDLINRFGDWWEANQKMNAALREKGYSVEFFQDGGFHAYWSGGRVLPECLKATWSGEVK